MKPLLLSLLAGALLLGGGVATAQKSLARIPPSALATYNWPKDAGGVPIPNAQNQCPSPYVYRQVTVQMRGANGVTFPYTKRWCEFVYNY